MSRVVFSVILIGMLFTWASNANGQRPNVLLILADDLGYSDLGFMGGEIPTPNLDRLAAQGIRFTQCYNSARCCPSRASLVTGLYPHQAGIGSFARSQPDVRRGPAYLGRLNDQCVTIAELLVSVGYQTYMVGKWHMGEPGPIERGFEEFYGYVRGYEQDQWEPSRYQRLPQGRRPELTSDEGEFYATDVFTDYALEFLDHARRQPTDGKQRPWFLYVAHSSPHFPVQAPRETVDRFVDLYRRGWDVLRDERFRRMRENGLAEPSWTLTERSPVPVDRDDIANGFSGELNPAWETLPADRREDLARRMAVFAAMVWHVDEGVGRLIADLEEHGELDNTIVMFLSDNGACYEWGPFGFDGPSRRGITKLHTGDELITMGGPGSYHSYGSAWSNLGNTPLRMYKHFTYEGGNCTPLLFHWPKGVSETDRWVREPVHLMDIVPTLCEVCEVEYPAVFDGREIIPTEGRSLMPLMTGESFEPRPIASEHNGARSLRRGDWKVVWPVKMPGESRWELYNLAEDRCETRDLAEEHPELTAELAEEWMAWARRVKVHPIYQPPNLPTERSPAIDQRPLTIGADIELPTDSETGVIVAQGGVQHGYALHLDEGKLIFSIRTAGEVTATDAVELNSLQVSIEALLKKDGKLILNVDGVQVATAQAPGLLPAQPSDPLSIGYDSQTAVGNYLAPSRLNGRVTNLKVNGEPIK